jgi:hypothetical protein
MVGADGSNSWLSCSGVRPDSTNSIICWRNSGVYGGPLLGMISSFFPKRDGVHHTGSTPPGSSRRAEGQDELAQRAPTYGARLRPRSVETPSVQLVEVVVGVDEICQPFKHPGRRWSMRHGLPPLRLDLADRLPTPLRERPCSQQAQVDTSACPARNTQSQYTLLRAHVEVSLLCVHCRAKSMDLSHHPAAPAPAGGLRATGSRVAFRLQVPIRRTDHTLPPVPVDMSDNAPSPTPARHCIVHRLCLS